MVVLVEGEDKSCSGACSAFPVWGGQNCSATSIARKAGSESYLEFHGAIPWRESLSTLFGERLAGCAILMNGIFVFGFMNGSNHFLFYAFQIDSLDPDDVARLPRG